MTQNSKFSDSLSGNPSSVAKLNGRPRGPLRNLGKEDYSLVQRQVLRGSTQVGTGKGRGKEFSGELPEEACRW